MACKPLCNSGLRTGSLSWLPIRILIPSTTIPTISANFFRRTATNPALEYASSDFDIKHRFTFSVTYAIPGMKAPGQLLQGWELNSVVTLQTGQPWYGNDQSNGISGTGENTDRWDFFGNPGGF